MNFKTTIKIVYDHSWSNVALLSRLQNNSTSEQQLHNHTEHALQVLYVLYRVYRQKIQQDQLIMMVIKRAMTNQ